MRLAYDKHNYLLFYHMETANITVFRDFREYINSYEFVHVRKHTKNNFCQQRFWFLYDGNNKNILCITNWNLLQCTMQIYLAGLMQNDSWRKNRFMTLSKKKMVLLVFQEAQQCFHETLEMHLSKSFPEHKALRKRWQIRRKRNPKDSMTFNVRYCPQSLVLIHVKWNLVSGPFQDTVLMGTSCMCIKVWAKKNMLQFHPATANQTCFQELSWYLTARKQTWRDSRETKPHKS